MPPRPDELPEGTDHIINGAMETGGADAGGAGGTGGSTGGAAATGGVETGGASGLIGAAGADDTGGTATSGGATGGAGGGSDGGGMSSSGGLTQASTSGGEAGGGVVEQLRTQVYSLRDQAGGRVREFADGGKTRASDALEELSRVVADTADSLDERLGREYGEYARKAADAVSGFADTLRTTDVEEIYSNVEGAVRKSPGIALGIAAVIGFTAARLVKSGLESGHGTNGDTTGGSGGNAGA